MCAVAAFPVPVSVSDSGKGNVHVLVGRAMDHGINCTVPTTDYQLPTYCTNIYICTLVKSTMYKDMCIVHIFRHYNCISIRKKHKSLICGLPK